MCLCGWHQLRQQTRTPSLSSTVATQAQQRQQQLLRHCVCLLYLQQYSATHLWSHWQPLRPMLSFCLSSRLQSLQLRVAAAWRLTAPHVPVQQPRVLLQLLAADQHRRRHVRKTAVGQRRPKHNAPLVLAAARLRSRSCCGQWHGALAQRLLTRTPRRRWHRSGRRSRSRPVLCPQLQRRCTANRTATRGSPQLHHEEGSSAGSAE